MSDKNYSEERESFQVVAWLAGILCLALLVFLAIPGSEPEQDLAVESEDGEAAEVSVPAEDQAFLGAKFIAENIAKTLDRRIELACENGEMVAGCSDSESASPQCNSLVRRFYTGPMLGNFRFEVVIESDPTLNCKLKHFCMASDTIGDKFLYYRPGVTEIMVANVPCKDLITELDAQESR